MKRKIIAVFAFFVSLSLFSCMHLFEDEPDMCTVSYYSQHDRENLPKSFKCPKGTKLTSDQLPVLTEEGYIFEGWNVEKTSVGSGFLVKENIVLTAMWEIVEYTIVYNLDGGINDDQNLNYYTVEKETFELKAPVKEGYDFAGWYTDEGLTEQVLSIKKGSVGNITLYAKWTTESFKITYYLNGGLNPSENPNFYTVEDDIILCNPERTGYDFAGWYADEGLNEQVVSIKKGSVGNITLYAKWTIQSFKITYYLNGGVNSGENPKFYTIEDEIILCNPERTGYDFAGWYADEGLTEQVVSIKKGSVGNKTLYAKWTSESFKITYNLNGGVNSSENPNCYTIEDEIILSNPKRTGYDFAGWYADEGLTEQVVSIKKGSVGSITLYAKWTIQSFKITYYLNGGLNSSENPNIYTIEDDIILCNPERTGYIFAGWYADEGLTEQVVSIKKGSVGNITLYAKWTTQSFKITYYLNGGVNSGENPKFYTIEDEIILCNPERTGYIFEGWYTNSTFAGSTINQIKKESTGPISLYAKWEARTDIPYVIYHYFQEKTGNNYILWSTENRTDGITDQPICWFALSEPGSMLNDELTKENGVLSKNAPKQLVNGDGSTVVELYYDWEIETVTFELNGGTGLESTTCRYCAFIDPPPTPKKTGYTFAGWYIDSSLVNIFDFSSMIGENIKLYAKWNVKTYTITFNGNGATTNGTLSKQLKYGEHIGSIVAPTKTDCIFVGYFIDKKGSGKGYYCPGGEQYWYIDDNITLYAKWIERFVKVAGTTIKGNESWFHDSHVFKKGRSLTIPDLYVCDHEVTRGEFKALMGEDPSTASAYDKDRNKLTGDDVLNNPVNYVNWYDAIAYCNKLSAKEGLTPAYTVSGISDWENLEYSAIPTSGDATWNAATCDFTASGYRLPTEAEWEWLARAGERYWYAGSDNVGAVAWYLFDTNYAGSRDVKTKAANGYGLYDMSGNVWEWCWDWYGSISSSTGASGASSGSHRVKRGGSWRGPASDCYVFDSNGGGYPGYRDWTYGFRVVRNAN